MIIADHWHAQHWAFVCAGCGRSIVAFGLFRMEVCAACLAVPGWYQHHEIVAQLDPENERDRSKITMGLAEIECRGAWLGATMAWLTEALTIENEALIAERDHLLAARRLH